MEYRVEDYVFADEATAEKARKEAETIKYIRSRTDFTKPENAKKIINTIRANNMFETELGLDFVAKLEHFAAGGEAAKDERLQEPAPRRLSEASEGANDSETESGTNFSEDEEERLREEVRRRTKHLKETAENRVDVIKKEYAAKARNLKIVIAALALVIVGLLVLTFLSDNSPFYDYEQAVLDKYSTWQEELDTKEQQLTRWEQELKEREEKLTQ